MSPDSNAPDSALSWSILAAVLRFLFGAIVVGVPFGCLFGFSWIVFAAVMVVCGFLAAIQGDDFFDRVAQSWPWRLLRAMMGLGRR